jgi:benzaldehyde dehydrogenase (NAD)
MPERSPKTLIAAPAVRRISFTGSTRVGKIGARLCVDAAAFGAFMNSGQERMSTERIIVDERIAELFVKRTSREARSLSVGDSRESAVALGSVIDMSTEHRCNALIDDAFDRGPNLVCGGRAGRTLMAATLLDRVTPDMEIFAEDSFAPVKAIVQVDGDDAAIGRAMQLANLLQSGVCHINGLTVPDEPQVPFGGEKDSELRGGRSRAGIAEFMELR